MKLWGNSQYCNNDKLHWNPPDRLVDVLVFFEVSIQINKNTLAKDLRSKASLPLRYMACLSFKKGPHGD